MGVSGKEFLGQEFYVPGGYGAFRSTEREQTQNNFHRTMIIIGKADNGNYCLDTTLEDSERVLEGSFDELKAIVKSGDLYDAMFLASRPGYYRDKAGNQIPFDGPEKFILFNINQNVAASNTILSTDGATSHTVTAKNAGAYGNRIRFRKTLSTKKIEITDGKTAITSPILERKIFEISYLGDATTALLVIGATGLTVTLAGDQTDGSLDLSILFSDVETVGELVDQINSSAQYSARLIDNPDFLTKNLDYILNSESIDITTLKTLYADLYQEESFLTGTGFVTITPGAVRKPISDMASFLFLSGGVTGVALSDAVKNAIDFSKKFKALYRNILSSSIADANHLKAACYDMLSPKGANETFGGFGADPSLTFDQRTQVSNDMAAYWVNCGLQSFFTLDENGVETEFPPYMLSVIDNAISASRSPRYSPTYKRLNITRAKEIFELGDLKKGIKAGGLTLFKKEDGFWSITRSVTTEKSSDIILNQKSSVASALWMVYRLRNLWNEKVIGESLVDDSALVQGIRDSDMRSFLERQLTVFVEEGLLVGSSLLGTLPFDPDFKINIDGNAWYFEFKGKVTMPIDFVFTLMELSANRGTV